MSTQPDKLFQRKLADHAMAPSAAAWGKVEAALGKKNNGLIWFRWAAVLLIPVILAGVLIMNRDSGKEKMVTTITGEKKITDKTGEKEAVKESDTKVKPEVAPTKKTPPADAAQKPALKSRPSRTNTPADAMQSAPNEAGTTVAAVGEQTEIPATPSTQIKPEQIDAALSTAVAAAPKEKAMVLEYTLESIAADAPVEKGITLTLELKEKNKFQKVFDFARDAKNGDGPLTALRQVKQEFFAFNLKKDKHPK